jgi:hypothetical protein
VAINPSYPTTWEKIHDDPQLKHLAENPAFYDGDVEADLRLMQSCGQALVSECPEVQLALQFEDDGTMHLEAEAPGRRPADLHVLLPSGGATCCAAT